VWLPLLVLWQRCGIIPRHDSLRSVTAYYIGYVGELGVLGEKERQGDNHKAWTNHDPWLYFIVSLGAARAELLLPYDKLSIILTFFPAKSCSPFPALTLIY